MSSPEHHAGVIAVGVDGSPAALSAVRWAAQDAARRHLRLRLVHALAAPLILYPGLVAGSENLFDDLLVQARRLLTEAADTARAVAPDVKVETVRRIASPASLLGDESRHVDTVAVGAHGRGGMAGLLLGSTTASLASAGHCAIAVIRTRPDTTAPPDTGPVVVGVDGSPASEAAIAYAFEQAAFRDAELVAVHAWSDLTIEASPVVYDVDAVEQEARRVLAERLAGWSDKYPDVTVRRVTTEDRPVQALLTAAADAQLLVVGCRGRGGFASLLLGSTSQSLLYHATLPIVIVRGQESARTHR